LGFGFGLLLLALALYIDEIKEQPLSITINIVVAFAE
jgi:hypothetical protein